MPQFVKGSGRDMYTVAPNDFGHFEMLNELVQHESAEALDPELAGLFAAIASARARPSLPTPACGPSWTTPSRPAVRPLACWAWVRIGTTGNGTTTN